MTSSTPRFGGNSLESRSDCTHWRLIVWVQVIGAVAVIFLEISCAYASLVVNGDFESGTSGITSDYTYQTGSNSLGPPSTWSVVTKANDVHELWTAANDHTYGNGSGHYFVANGSDDTTKAVWQTSAPLTVTQANTAYRFEAYITSLYAVGNAGPILTFQVGDGAQWYDMGTTQTFPNDYTPGAWSLAYYDGVFTRTGSYYLRLLNAQSATLGNDLGVDDIYFGQRSDALSVGTYSGLPAGSLQDINANGLNPVGTLVPEPSTFFLAGTGFAGLLCLRRRK